jgi:hypothetical protein
MDKLAHKVLEVHLAAEEDKLHTQAEAAAEVLEELENMHVA